MITTVPLSAVALITVSGSPSGSLSLPSTVIVTAVFTLVVALSSTAIGGWLGITSITTTSVSHRPKGSQMLIVSVSPPVYPGSGV